MYEGIDELARKGGARILCYIFPGVTIQVQAQSPFFIKTPSSIFILISNFRNTLIPNSIIYHVGLKT